MRSMATPQSWLTPRLINQSSSNNSQRIPTIKEKEEEPRDFNPLHRARITTNSSNTHSYNSSKAIVLGRNLSITVQQMQAIANNMHSSHRCRTIIIRGKEEGVDRTGNNSNRHMTTLRMLIWELEVPRTITMEDNNKGGKVGIAATISMGRIIRGPTKMR
jgi:hypothetical protein